MPYFSQNVKSDMMRHSEVVFRINRRYFYGSAQAKIKINVFISDDLHNGHNCKAIAAISSLISIFNFLLFSSPSESCGGGQNILPYFQQLLFYYNIFMIRKKWLHGNCIYNEIPLERRGKLKRTRRGAASIHLSYVVSDSTPTPVLMEVCRLDRSEQTN